MTTKIVVVINENLKLQSKNGWNPFEKNPAVYPQKEIENKIFSVVRWGRPF